MTEQKIFFSYARTDTAVALRLATDLKAAGADVWIDQLNIPIGSTWDLEIEKALEACNCVLFIASKTSVASDNALNEVYYALDEKKRVLPVKIDDCKIPFRIQRLQHIDLSLDYDKQFAHLLLALNLGAGRTAADSRPPVDSTTLTARTEETMHEAPRPTEWQQKDPAAEAAPKKSLLPKLLMGGGVLVVLVILFFLFSSNDKGVNEKSAADTNTVAAVGSSEAAAMSSPVSKAEADSLNGAGDAQYDKKDYAEAFRLYQQAAAGGSADAMYNIGILYQNGQGVDKDYGKAMDWYQKAASAGNVPAMNSIGFLYEYGSGMAKEDYTKAMEWYRRAADSGDAEAMHNIGSLYEHGEGVEANMTEANKWYRKAREAGYKEEATAQ